MSLLDQFIYIRVKIKMGYSVVNDTLKNNNYPCLKEVAKQLTTEEFAMLILGAIYDDELEEILDNYEYLIKNKIIS